MANENIYPPFRPEHVLGRPLKMTPTEMLEKFGEYIDWAKAHPITLGSTEESSNARGDTYGKETRNDIPRRLSIEGFLVHIGCSECWWRQLDECKQAEEFSRVKDYIRAYCENYQKEMASAGIFNANILARLLGLAEKTENKNENTNREFRTVAEWKEYVKGINE